MGPASTRRIFVYGTLLRGESNHDLLRGARFVGEAQTQPGFELYDLGGYPGMVRGGDGVVLGELWDVGAKTLAALDELEQAPTHYQRVPILLQGSVQALTYIYALDLGDAPRLPPGADSAVVSWRRRP